MFSNQVHKRIHFGLSCLIAFTLAFKIASPILLTLLLINWLLEAQFTEKFKQIKYPAVLYLLVAFYGLHLVSLVWGADTQVGLFKLEVKLPLLVCPLIFATRPFSKNQVSQILSCYVCGCAVACIMLFVRAGVLSYDTDSNYFFYTKLSWFLHTGYLAMYLNLGLAYMLLSLPIKDKKAEKLWWFMFFLLVLTIILLSSKTGHIALFFILFIWSGKMILRQKKYLTGTGVIILMILAIFTLWSYSPFLSSRAQHAMRVLSDENIDKNSTESTAVRLLMWKAALDLSYKAPVLGTGIGSEQEPLIAMYRQRGIQWAVDLNLNTHNTYLQTLVSLGCIGLIMLLAVLFLPLYIAIKQKHALYGVFVLLIIFNFIPESVLETQAGTMFFGFFNGVLFFSENKGLHTMTSLLPKASMRTLSNFGEQRTFNK